MTNDREDSDMLSDKENESFEEPLPETAPQESTDFQSTSQQTSQLENSVPKTEPKIGRAWPVWQLTAAFVVAVSGSLGFIATASLLKLPTTANCPQINWPWASASMRLYCAQIQAENRTTESLVDAIKQVENLPKDHPLRSEVDRNIEVWIAEILDLADEEFQAGKLPEAIAIARLVPPGSKYQNLVDQKIAYWQEIWNKAEQTYQNIEEKLTERNWNRAFREAVALTTIDNEYWATTKYEETINRIQSAREDGTKLETAYNLLEKGNIDDLLKAVEQVKTIDPKSYVYQEAQDIITQAKQKVASQVEELIDKQQWAQLSQKLQQIPDQLELQEEIKDWTQLTNAGNKASSGKKPDLELAITQLETIDPERPLYFKAQELINRWRQEIEDVAVLEKAQELAESGNIEDLNAAIAQVQLISAFNPRYDQAQSQIKKWVAQIEIIEDGPTLEQARKQARLGTPNACNEAITQASLIAPGRALYDEAQQVVSKCQYSLQLQQDQPFLDQAVALAKAGDWQGAINTAEQISPGRALYPKAKTRIAAWQGELQARQLLQQAYQASSAKTSESLARAIAIAQRISPNTQVKKESVGAINGWSEELLVMADLASSSSVEEAIAIAKNIPPGTSAYYSAKAKIDLWRRRIQPLPPLIPRDDTPAPQP